MSTPSDQHTPAASEAYELEVVKVPLIKRVFGEAITSVVGMVSGQGVPYPFDRRCLYLSD